MKNHNLVRQTGANIPGFPGRRNPETPGMPEFPDRRNARNAGFAGQISLALPAEYQSNPEIRRFSRFCRSEIATLVRKRVRR